MNNTLTITLALALALAGCGKSAAPTSSAAAAPPPAPKGEMSAEQVAAQARGGLSCPHRPSSPAPDAPVVDVLGVRPGQSYDDAAALVMCSAPLMVVTPDNDHGYTINTSGTPIRQGFNANFAQAHHELSGREIVKQMQQETLGRGLNRRHESTPEGESRWYVGTVGLPGAEQVTNAAREEHYAPGQQPSIASLMDALVKKYGAPSIAYGNAGVDQSLRWIRDPEGRLAAPGSSVAQRCNLGPTDPDSGFSINEGCGLVVSAHLLPSRANPELAEKLQVGVVDAAKAVQLIQATEAALAARKRQSQQQEVQQAEKKVPPPSL